MILSEFRPKDACKFFLRELEFSDIGEFDGIFSHHLHPNAGGAPFCFTVDCRCSDKFSLIRLS
ncbi:hypothetical protein LEP1GSC170_0132 [Leptospira interrogans serovar Bataviae str. HAI135]|nr:hypothetical protein LEP1GSC170_0132 [Leptospira interrogans serovar Bataviae str. HAI135]